MRIFWRPHCNVCCLSKHTPRTWHGYAWATRANLFWQRLHSCCIRASSVRAIEGALLIDKSDHHGQRFCKQHLDSKDSRERGSSKSLDTPHRSNSTMARHCIEAMILGDLLTQFVQSFLTAVPALGHCILLSLRRP